MMKLFAKTILLSILFLPLACDNRDSYQFDEKIIERVGTESVNFPSFFSSSLFFVKCTSNQIGVLQIQELREIYRNEYYDLEYMEFISLSLNQALDFNDKDINCFDVTPDIENVYRKGGIKSIIEKYCVTVDDQTFKIREGLIRTEINSILYYLFINNYLNFFDDVRGNYYIKSSDSLKREVLE